MAWLLNRTGQPEGPFEDGQLLQMIQSGQVTSGQISQPGTEQWMPIANHPPFAQALHAGAAAAAPPAAGGYPPVGAPPAAAGYPPVGAPPAAAPGGPMPGPGGPAAPKKGGMGIGMIIGIVVGAIVVIGGIVGLVMMLGGGGGKLASKVPKDIEMYMEVPSIPGALSDFAGMDVVNAKEIDSKKQIKDVRKGLEDAFGIKKADAEDIMASVESIASASRGMMDKEQSAVLVQFSGTDGMEKLLKSDRFTDEGEFANGTRYSLKSVEMKDINMEDMAKWSMPRKSFSFMSVSKESKRQRWVWYPDEGLLVMGNTSLVEDIGDVVTEGADSLADTEKWGEAKFESGAAAIGFVDSKILKDIKGDEEEKIVKGYFREIAPFSGSVELTGAGMLISMRGEMKGNKIGEDDELPSAATLDLYEKLPKETVAYLAVSMKRDEDGKALKKRMLKKLKSIDEKIGEAVGEGLNEMRDEIGISLEDIVDSVGDQMIMAVAAKTKFAFDEKKKPQEYIDDAGFAYIVSVGKFADAKKVVKVMREKLFEDGPMKEAYEVSKKGKGFDAKPKEEGQGMPTVQVRLTEEYLLVTGGGLAKRFVEALEKDKKTLADDAAHKTALGTVSGSPRMVMWVDIGRIGKVGLDWVNDQESMKEEMKEQEKELGISTKALKVKGDDRVTSLVAINIDSSSDTWTYHVQSLNAPALGILAGASMFMKSMGGSDEVLIPDTGIAFCDALVSSKFSCGVRTGDEAMKKDARMDERVFKDTLREDSSQKDGMEKVCMKRHMEFIKDHPQCTQ